VNKGNIVGGQQNDLALHVRPSELGPYLSIFLAEGSDSTDSWRIQVRVMTDQGAVIVGEGHTVPPSAAGEPPSRMVGAAFAPGAKGWMVTAFTENRAAQAQLILVSGKDGGSLSPGLTMVKAGSNNRSANPFITTFAAAGPVSLALATPGQTVRELSGSWDPTLAAAGFVLVFDQAVAPVAGDVPIWGAHVGGTDPTRWLWAPGDYIVRNTLWVGLSSTQGTFTPIVAARSTIYDVIQQ